MLINTAATHHDHVTSETNGALRKTTWQEQFPYRSHEVDIEGATMRYIDEGEGPPILAVHGNPTWSFYWRHIIREFCDSHRVVAPDHIGMGRSDKPLAYDYSLQQHTTNLVRLIDALDLKEITLLGHDWGGAIALGAMMQRPERIKQFVLFNTGAFPPPSVPRRIAVCRTPWLGRVAVQGLNLFAKAAVSMATTQRGGLSSPAAEGMLAPYQSWNDRIGIYQFVADIPFNDAHKTWIVLEQLEQQLPNFSHLPSMLVWGMQDWCFDSDCLKRFEQLLPTATVHRLLKAGHWVIEDATNEVNVLLRRFLSGDGQSPAQTDPES